MPMKNASHDPLRDRGSNLRVPAEPPAGPDDPRDPRDPPPTPEPLPPPEGDPPSDAPPERVRSGD